MIGSCLKVQEKIFNENVKIVVNFLEKEYPTSWDMEELEQDIITGYTSLEKELFNVYIALMTLKEYSKNNQKKVKIIEYYLKLLKENGL